MKATRPALPLLVTLLLCVLAHGDVSVRWKGKKRSVEALPADFPEPARGAVEFWAPWCEKEEYRMHLEEGGRVLLIAPGGKTPTDKLRLVERVVELFEREFPAPVRERELSKGPQEASGDPKLDPGDKEGSKKKPRAIPEDPEAGDHPWDVRGKKGIKKATPTTPTTWGAEDVPLDHDPAVFVVAKDQEEYKGLLEHLIKDFDYLKTWKATALRQQGFVNAWPLTACYMSLPDGVEEWSPNNELVNRLARILFLRRFGKQPYWAELGIGWHFEMKLFNDIYVFPYRDEFVWAVEHAAWPSDLAKRFGDRKREPLRGEEFFGYERGEYLPLESRLSFGFMHFIAQEGNPDLSDFFEALRKHYDEQSIVKTGTYSWKRDPNYRIPAEEQAALARKFLGEDVFDRASMAFRGGLSRKRRK